ncbi:MAG TPA: replicative DNA helicase, partial [Clostridiales bacterium]|nr:replicative DNA helicase [Clostridiales bacterium]
MDELLGKKIPYSSQAEQAVIGSMLIDPRCIAEVIKKLRPDEFYVRANRDIFETIVAMFSYGQTVDPVTVLDQMKVRGVGDDNTPGYLAEIIRVTPTSANAMEYAAIVRDRALLRSIGTVADEINTMVYEGSGEADSVLEAAEAKMYALREGRGTSGLKEIRYVMQNVFDAMSEAASSGSRIPGLSTGLPDLDNMILGLNKSELILIAARPGMGKTSIALNMALNVAMTQHKKVAMFSLEMSREQLVSRLLSRASLVPSQNLLTGQLTEQQWRDVAAAANTLS